MKFVFSQTPTDTESLFDIGDLFDADSRYISYVRYQSEPRDLLINENIIDQISARFALYDAVDVALTRIFGDRWQRAFADVCGIDHRFLRREEFVEGLLPPRILMGIRELALSDATPAIGPLLTALAKSGAKDITDRDVRISVKLHRLLRE